MNTRTVTRKQKTTVRSRPNKTIRRSRHKTTTEGYSKGYGIGDRVAHSAASLSLATFNVMHNLRASKPVKRIRRGDPVKTLRRSKPVKAVRRSAPVKALRKGRPQKAMHKAFN